MNQTAVVFRRVLPACTKYKYTCLYKVVVNHPVMLARDILSITMATSSYIISSIDIMALSYSYVIVPPEIPCYCLACVINSQTSTCKPTPWMLLKVRSAVAVVPWNKIKAKPTNNTPAAEFPLQRIACFSPPLIFWRRTCMAIGTCGNKQQGLV